MKDIRNGLIKRRYARLGIFAGVVLLAGCGTAVALCQAHPAAAHPAAEPASNAEGSAQSANGAAPGQPTAPKPATATRLAALPEPIPAALTKGIDVGARSKSILEHLSEVIRFYRMTVIPIQKSGEPSDMLYAEQAQTMATQVAQLAFQSARDEAGLLARVQVKPGVDTAKPVEGEAQRLSAAQVDVAAQIRSLQTQSETLGKQLDSARAKSRDMLEQQKTDVDGQLELAQATSEALAKVSGISSSQTNSGLQGDIDRLQHAVPEIVDSKIKPVPNTIESVNSLRDEGVTSQALVLFQLLATQHAIDERIQETQALHNQADDLRTPLIKILKATLDAGKKLQGDAAAGIAADASATNGSPAKDNSSDLRATKKTFDQLTNAFKTISGVSVPISQELLLLEEAQGNLLSWRASVDAERIRILHSLLIRVVLIAGALAFILLLGEVWRRATARYVQDVRRRRQLLLIRRMVVGFLSALVLILGFVTQFSSLATFAGFITAGVAVGLQTILLSVAAYFFIVGRYGVRVGDRITVANVTGDVVEVGLVRFYMMELAGTGTEFHPTGRIAVFANSVLFQTGTPLYKQIPGTNYAWHEVTVKLKPGTDYKPALNVLRGAVEKVYNGYKTQIERQHSETENWMDTAMAAPGIQTRLQLADGLQYAVLFPVEIANAASIDDQVVQGLLEAVANDPAAMQVIEGAPSVRAVIKT
jgi:small-conductance mechanosensitive channel